MSYSQFMGKVHAHGIELNRKVLADSSLIYTTLLLLPFLFYLLNPFLYFYLIINFIFIQNLLYLYLRNQSRGMCDGIHHGANLRYNQHFFLFPLKFLKIV